MGIGTRIVPKKIQPQQRAVYRRLRNSGVSQLEAARKARFSRSYARKLEAQGLEVPREGRDGKVYESTIQAITEMEREEELRPKQLHELDGVAKDCLDDFGRFRARYLGSMSYPWQEEAARIVITHLESGDDSFGVINCPQGSGKTRLFSHDIPAWITARDRSLRGILGSAGLGVSQSMSRNLRDTLERTTPVRARDVMVRRGLAANADATLAQDYGRFKPSASGGLWRADAFTVEQLDGATTQDKESTWAAFSYEAKFLSWRVDFMQWDDVHTQRQLSNPDGMEALFRWWDAEAESRLDPGGLCLVTMQRLGANDLSRYLLDKIDPEFEVDADRPDDTPRQYFHVVYKAHYDDRCHDHHRKTADPYPAGCMLQPDRITWAKIKQKKIAGNYQVVYQQEDTDPANVLVQTAWVNGGTASDGTEHEGCWDKDRTIGQMPTIPPGSFAIRYMTVDPSPTKWWGCLAEGTEVTTARGRIPIEAVTTDDLVLTRGGYLPVAHCTFMGHKKTIRLELSTGRVLVLTPDHKVLTLDGWVEAGRLLPGATLCGAPTVGRPLAGTASAGDAPPSVLRDEVVAAVGVAARAVGLGELCLDEIGASDVVSVRFQNEMVRVDAGPDVAEVGHLHVGRDGVTSPLEESHGQAVGQLLTRGEAHRPVPVGGERSLPDPATVVVCDGSGSEIRRVDRDAVPFGNGAVAGADPTGAPTVVSTRHGFTLPTYDIGVNGEYHEFVAEGVVVHNCLDWLYVLPNGVEPMGGYRYLLNLCRKKMGANEFLDYSRAQDDFVGLADEWVKNARAQGLPITYLIMEKNAAQRWAMQYEFFNNWRMARGINVIPHETMSNKTDPELGVWATIPACYRYGRVRLPGGDTASKQTVYPLVQEVTTYPNGSTDDQLMSQWFGEYNLQHLVAIRKAGARVHKGLPSWMKER